MQLIKIGTTDVILQDFEENEGKIIISDNEWSYNFSHYWSAMGSNLKNFLLKISEGYFIDKLTTNRKGNININKSIKCVEKEIFKDLKGPKYKHVRDTLKIDINNIRYNIYDDRSFIENIQELNDYFYDVKDSKYIKEAIQNVTVEPWHHMVYDISKESLFLKKLLPKLKKQLKKSLK